MQLTDDRWTTIDDLHRWLAELDAPDPAPLLAGFVGETLLALVRLRRFRQGAYHDPLIEALALALPLGADRISVALPGRAWSMDDPLPPVTAGGDLRQRVLTQVSVDGHGHAPPLVQARLHPFRTDGHGRLVWDDPVDPGPGEGWIPDALAAMVDGRHRIGADATPAQLMQQAERLEDLGHLVILTRAGQRRTSPLA